MQVLLLPLIIIRMILSIFMSITTMSFLSQSKRNMQQAHASRYPGQVQQPTKGMTGKSLVLVLAIVGVCLFVAIQGAPAAAPQAAPTTSAETRPTCQDAKHSKSHRHHKPHQSCNPS